MKKLSQITSRNLEQKINLFKEFTTRNINYDEVFVKLNKDMDEEESDSFIRTTEREIMMIVDIFETIYDKLEEIKTLIEEKANGCNNQRN